MKPRLLELVSEASAAESVYAEKYEWLMRWALHFCNGDKEMAEDLVQDTFVRMISSWQTIRDLENPERFLYTYLKYGFLRLRAEDRRQTMQSVSVEDLDLLDRTPPNAGPSLLEWQQNLRTVVDFLCWRKATAKSASLLLLRFFHGLFPAEIMLVARLTRKAVDDGLASARHEARSCATRRPLVSEASNRGTARIPSHSGPHIVSPLLSTEDFMRQMLSLVFAASDGECLSIVALQQRYSEQSRSPIDCWLLSHVVSCRRCLDLVLEINTLPPRGTRPLEDVLGYAPKADGVRPRKKAAPISAGMRSMTAGWERYHKTLETRPQTISVAVNGQCLASSDVSSALNMLTVDLHSGPTPELIEVYGDTALLFSVPVYAAPPAAEPVQHFLAELIEGRTLELTFELNATGARLHVTYSDELFCSSASTALASAPQLLFSAYAKDRAKKAQRAIGTAFGSKIKGWLKRPFESWFKLSFAFASMVLVCTAGYRYSQAPQPYAVLTQAVKAVRQQTTGVVTQRVRIASYTPRGKSSLEVTLHRDLAHKLKPKSSQIPENDARMESARIVSNDPLSPADFRQWRDEQREASDELHEAPNGRLTVISTTSTGPVAEESITLDAQTFHAVKRTVRFRDSEEIEVAELDYGVVPLANSDPAWFAPLPFINDGKHFQGRSPITPLHELAAANLSDEQLEVAELNVRLALIELQADGRERLTIQRKKDGIVIEGLVATDERKHEIERRMHQLAHVASKIQTFSDFAFASSAKREVAVESIAVASATDGPSPLDKLSTERHLSIERLSALHASLLNVAVQLKQSATAMRDLDERFHNGKPSPDAMDLRFKLRSVYADRMKSATEMETRTLNDLGIALENSPSKPDDALSNIAAVNAHLCFELISQAEDPRSAQTILHELAASVRTLQQTLLQLTKN